MAGKTQKVTVIVPARDGYPGIWAAGKLWPTGEQEADVTQEELQALASKRGLIVQQNGKTVRLEQAPTATTTMQLTSDEVQALERYRTDRHAKAVAEQSITSEPQFSRTSENVGDAGGMTPSPGSHSDAPAEHREVMQGDKPAGTKKR